MSWRWHWRSCSTFHSIRWSSGIDAFFPEKKTLNTNLVPHRTHSPRSKKKTRAKSAETHLASGKPISVLLMTSTLRWTLKRGRWNSLILVIVSDVFDVSHKLFLCLEWIKIPLFSWTYMWLFKTKLRGIPFFEFFPTFSRNIEIHLLSQDNTFQTVDISLAWKATTIGGTNFSFPWFVEGRLVYQRVTWNPASSWKSQSSTISIFHAIPSTKYMVYLPTFTPKTTQM